MFITQLTLESASLMLLFEFVYVNLSFPLMEVLAALAAASEV